MAQPYPTLIPGLRSPFDQVNGLVYFGRMLDKIRLYASGKLPEGWHAARGSSIKGSFDWRCCQFLKIDYAALEAETLKGDKTGAELRDWAFQHGRQPGDQAIEVWNAFMTNRGWRDAGTQRLNERLAEIGLPPRTMEHHERRAPGPALSQTHAPTKNRAHSFHRQRIGHQSFARDGALRRHQDHATFHLAQFGGTYQGHGSQGKTHVDKSTAFPGAVSPHKDAAAGRARLVRITITGCQRPENEAGLYSLQVFQPPGTPAS